MSDSGAPPGLYPDPAGGPGQRWWNGTGWTAYTSPAAQPPDPGWGAPPPVRAWDASASVAAEQGFNRWGQAAVLGYAVMGVVSIVVYLGLAARFHRFYEWFRAVVDHAGSPGYVAPPAPALLPGWFSLLGLVSVASFVVFLVWQYRAATAARALGRPATRSPGWGVGSWFVPVVNLWMPFQALRDCLPSGHPRRRLPWVLLAAGVVIYLGGLGTGIGLAVDRGVGDVFAVVTVAAWILGGGVALAFVRTVGEANRGEPRTGV